MSKIIAAIRKEVVVIAGAVTAALNVVLANGHVLSAIIPVILSLIVRSQVSPVAKLEQLLKLISQLRKAPKVGA